VLSIARRLGQVAAHNIAMAQKLAAMHFLTEDLRSRFLADLLGYGVNRAEISY
jgi:hypothetical protein